MRRTPKTTHSWAARTMLLAALLICLGGCTRGHAGPAHGSVVVAADAAASLASPASDAATASTSDFSTVMNARTELVRVSGGPALAIAGDNASFLLALGADGSVTPVAPLVALFAEESPYRRIGDVIGEWPHALYVETGQPGANAPSIVQNLVLDVDTRAITRASYPGDGHIAAASAWSKGRRLGFAVKDTTLDFKYVGRGSGGQFVDLSSMRESGPRLGLIAEPARPLRLPASVMTDGKFVAFASGRVFLIGDVMPKGAPGAESPAGPVEMTRIYDFTDEAHPPSSVAMPGPIDQLVRGRSERETLVRGAKYLERFDGAAWVDVPLPSSEPLRSVSIGDDGSIWLTTTTELWRASFASLRFTRVALPGTLADIIVVARNDSDVWLTALTDAKDESSAVLLHSQKARPPFVLPERDALYRAALFEKDPAPYSRSCRIPFLALGTPEQVGDSEVEAFRAAMPDWPFDKGLVGRTHAGEVVGFELRELEEAADKRRVRAMYRDPAATLAAARSKRPQASLLCTMPTVERRL